MNRPFSVLIPDGESEFSLFAIHCLADFPDVTVHVLSGERWASPRFSRYCRSFTYKKFNPNDDEARLEFLATLVKKHNIDVLLPTETKWISFVVANLQPLLSFVKVAPVPDPASFELANNKWKLAQFLEEHQIPGPPTLQVTNSPSLEKELEAIQFPVLLKPVSAWGGEGIERFENPASLKEYLKNQKPETLNERFIIQSLLPGVVVGVNVLAYQGKILATTMQRGVIPNTQKYAAAGGIKFIQEDKFFTIAQKLIKALSWTGFANIDTLHDSRDDQLKILEINARFWGSLRGSLVAGVSFPYLACLAALNIPFEIPTYNLAHYIHSKTALRQGVLKLKGQADKNNFNFKETGLYFLLTDPLAEIIRAFQQEVLKN